MKNQQLLTLTVLFLVVLGIVAVYVLHSKNKPTSDVVMLSLSSLRKQHPNIEILSHDPRVVLFHQFLSPEECQHLMDLAQPRLKQSTVQTETLEKSPDRTSFSTNLLKSETGIVKAIEERASALCGYPLENLEPLQVVRYQPNQFYKAHYDYFPPGTKGASKALKRGGQRTVTFFVYLNQMPANETGGCTSFPKLDIKVKPTAGSALCFYNVLSSGKEDDRMLHAGEPPKSGVKYGLNMWFREQEFH